MSFWIHRKDKAGRIHYVSVSIPVFLVVALLGMLLACILPYVAWLRAWLRG